MLGSTRMPVAPRSDGGGVPDRNTASRCLNRRGPCATKRRRARAPCIGRLPVYRMVLRAMVGRMVTRGDNLVWSIEGGRSRTGKLRPPRFGLLRYVTDAIESTSAAEALIVPVSIMYDQLSVHEVELMVSESRGGSKHRRTCNGVQNTRVASRPGWDGSTWLSGRRSRRTNVSPPCAPRDSMTDKSSSAWRWTSITGSTGRLRKLPRRPCAWPCWARTAP
jgi:hypothetical protein